MAKLLLEANLKAFSLKDNEGNTPLDLAIKTDNYHISNFLRKISASPKQLKDAFILAIEIVKELLKRNAKGDRALQLLISKKDYETAKLFADRGIVNWQSVFKMIDENNIDLLKHFFEQLFEFNQLAQEQESILRLSMLDVLYGLLTSGI